MRRRRSFIVIFASLLAVASIACAGCGPNVHSGDITIVINSSSFSPGSITVSEGTLVTWINQDSQPHTATAIGAFDSGVIPPNGGRWSWVASIAGTFDYHSQLQPSMAGSITVVVQGPTGY